MWDACGGVAVLSALFILHPSTFPTFLLPLQGELRRAEDLSKWASGCCTPHAPREAEPTEPRAEREEYLTRSMTSTHEGVDDGTTGYHVHRPMGRSAAGGVGTKFKDFGYDGLELACWGDHFEVDLALAEDDYCAEKRELLEKNGMQVFAISNHLVGQAVLDVIDSRHKAILPPHVWGDGNPAGVNQRAAEEMKNTARAAQKLGVTVVNGFTGSSIWQLLYSFPPVSPADDRRRLQAAGRALQPDPRRVRRVRREVRPGSPSHGDRLRSLHGRAGPGSARTIARSSASTSTPAI